MIKIDGEGAALSNQSLRDVRVCLADLGSTRRPAPGVVVAVSTLALACLTSLGVQTARAQDDSGGAKLEEIVVTASKREELLSKTPNAVTAITSQSLDQLGIKSTSELTASVPSLQMSTESQGSLVIGIRGISSNNVTELGNPAVAFHIDGVYEPRPEGINEFLADIDRIEVLRGPQGTLYGRNATAGSINVISASPTDSLEAKADLSYGNYNDVLTRGVLNIPVVEGFALRLAVFRDKNDGYTDTQGSVPRNYDLTDQYGGRLTALWSALSNFTWKLSVDSFRDNGTPPLGVPYPYSGSVRDVTVNTPGDIDDRSFAVRSRMNWLITYDWSLTYVAGYADIHDNLLTDSDGTATRDLFAHYLRDEEHFSHELDLQYDTERVKALLGLFYFDEKPHTILLSGISPTQTLQFYDLTVEQKSKAAFGQMTYSLSDRIRATAGLRYSDDNATRPLQNNYLCPASTPVTPSGPPGCITISHITNQDATWNNTSYKFTLDGDLTDKTLAYATVATGYKAGGLGNNIAPNFNPEHVRNYELGVKSRLADETVQLNAALYTMRYSDLQVTSIVDVPGTTALLAATTNAARASIKGVELEAAWMLSRNDHLQAYATYTDARYDSFPNAIDGYVDPSGKTLFNLSGYPLALAPDYAARVGYDHSFGLADGATLTPAVSVYWQSSMYLRPNTLGIGQQGAYSKSDCRLTYAAANGHWELEGFVHNIENKDVATSENVLAVGELTRVYSAPRTYGMRVSVKM
jgi:iron complex outermembrane recepter protein